MNSKFLEKKLKQVSWAIECYILMSSNIFIMQ